MEFFFDNLDRRLNKGYSKMSLGCFSNGCHGLTSKYLYSCEMVLSCWWREGGGEWNLMLEWVWVWHYWTWYCDWITVRPSSWWYVHFPPYHAWYLCKWHERIHRWLKKTSTACSQYTAKWAEIVLIPCRVYGLHDSFWWCLSTIISAKISACPSLTTSNNLCGPDDKYASHVGLRINQSKPHILWLDRK